MKSSLRVHAWHDGPGRVLFQAEVDGRRCEGWEGVRAELWRFGVSLRTLRLALRKQGEVLAVHLKNPRRNSNYIPWLGLSVSIIGVGGPELKPSSPLAGWWWRTRTSSFTKRPAPRSCDLCEAE